MSRFELATRADRGVGYIAKLEQDQPGEPSIETVESLAEALEASSIERRHLLDLRTYPGPVESSNEFSAKLSLNRHVTDDHRAFIDGLNPTIAGFVDEAWNVIYPNSAYRHLYRRIADPDVGNVLLWFFFVPESRQIMIEWQREALLTVSWLRVLMVQHRESADFGAILAHLSKSAEFRAMWELSDVELGGTNLR